MEVCDKKVEDIKNQIWSFFESAIQSCEQDNSVSLRGKEYFKKELTGVYESMLENQDKDKEIPHWEYWKTNLNYSKTWPQTSLNFVKRNYPLIQ